MKRIILAVLLGLLLLPTPGSAQYGPGRAERTVDRWYHRYLHRAPDPAAQAWVDALRAGQSPEALLSQILGSDEYYEHAGANVPGFIRQLYMDLAGRWPGPRETAFWERRVYQSDRQDVAYDMLRRFPQTHEDPVNLYPGEGTYPYRRPVYPDWRR